MKITRLAALLAVPAALSLAACGGGSTSTFVNNATQGTAQVRFVQGDPKLGAVDIYFYQSNASQPANATKTSVAFGEATDYTPQTAVPNTLVARAPGQTSGAAITACNLPAITNTFYSVVIADQNGAPNCMVFQDSPYTNAPQYRMHHAASIAVANNSSLGTIDYGVGTAAAAFTVQGTSTLGGFVGSQNPVTLAGTSGNQAAASGTVFGIGPSSVAVGSTDTATASLAASAVFAPDSLTQPDTAGTLNFAPYVGTSLYAIDCTGPITGGSAAIPCNGGVALIGVFDTK
jgi:hypothetical protein